MLNETEARRLLEKLFKHDEEGVECVICLEDLDGNSSRVLRGCGHCFCVDCLGQ
ncbi:hypothetical protein T484DRAFT_1858552 [Baffinella frigidus]|nr:hypothetical protein T484DRAFT_1858552 [Cryptophyta sp. CCMP2293]